MTIWFTSDTHFNHANVIKYCNRPFKTVEAMNFAIADNWRAKIKSDDQVYFLGDFCLGKDKDAVEILNTLPGQKFLIIGNHDTPKIKTSSRWSRVCDYHELHVPGAPLIVLCHYPFAVWNKSHHGSINLHGHSHGTFNMGNLRQIDVGVDCWNYEPVSLAEIMDRIQERENAGKPLSPVDHHGR